jgi:glycosyltransferase involved in cell wall biosynthesis
VLVILSTHPIQYQVPLWQEIARQGQIPFEVWYLTRHATEVSRDREFGKSFAWDLEMLSGYPHRFLDVDPTATPNTFWKCRLPASFAEQMQTEEVKALWIQGWHVAAYWQAAWAAKKVGAKLWLRGESNDLAPAPFWKHAIKRFILGQLFRRVDRFLYIGKANRRLYEKFGLQQDRLYPAPYAVDNERFARQANQIRKSKLEIRKQWGIPEDAFCVLFCGKFISKKRPLDLIKAAQLLLRSHPEVKIHLLFVGSGELGDRLRAECDVVFDAEAPVRSEVRGHRSDETKPPASFAGFLNQTEISQAYVAADCLVLPSDHRETWGLVVNEAMASGLPCIISDRCGCAEDLGTHRPNALFSCGSVSELCDKIREAARDDRKPTTFDRLPSLEDTAAMARSLYSALENLQGSGNA